MSFWSIVGGVAGFVIGGPGGAVAGAAIGGAIDSANSASDRANNTTQANNTTENLYRETRAHEDANRDALIQSQREALRSQESHFHTLDVKQEAASALQRGERAVGNAVVEDLRYMGEWAQMVNHLDENQKAQSAGLDAPYVHTDIPGILFERPDTTSRPSSPDDLLQRSDDLLNRSS